MHEINKVWPMIHPMFITLKVDLFWIIFPISRYTINQCLSWKLNLMMASIFYWQYQHISYFKTIYQWNLRISCASTPCVCWVLSKSIAFYNNQWWILLSSSRVVISKRINHGEKFIHPTLFGCDTCGKERWKCKTYIS